MAPPKKRPSDETLLELRNNGWSDARIGAAYDLHPVYVSKIFRQILDVGTPRPRYDDLLPWRVRNEHKDARAAVALRTLAKYRRVLATGGDPETEVDSVHLGTMRNILDTLEEYGAVIDYDPDYPTPNSMSTTGGFHMVARRPEDGSEPIRSPWRKYQR